MLTNYKTIMFAEGHVVKIHPDYYNIFLVEVIGKIKTHIRKGVKLVFCIRDSEFDKDANLPSDYVCYCHYCKDDNSGNEFCIVALPEYVDRLTYLFASLHEAGHIVLDHTTSNDQVEKEANDYAEKIVIDNGLPFNKNQISKELDAIVKARRERRLM